MVKSVVGFGQLNVDNIMDSAEMDEMAEKLFLSMLGKPTLQNQHLLEVQRKDALALRDRWKNDFYPRGIYKYYDGYDIQSQTLHMEGEQVRLEQRVILCKEFLQMDSTKVVSAMLYILTASDLPSQDSILNDLYLDMWQSAYLDAAREALKQRMKRYLSENIESSFSISPSYGPGFYGMELSELEKFYDLSEGAELSISMKKGLLNPTKSCTGVFFGLDEVPKISNPCMYCIGSHNQCGFCNGGKG